MNYSFADKEKLAYKINKLNKRKYFNDIKNIIVKYNPNIETTNSSRGIFLRFQDLNDITYRCIDKYLKNIKCYEKTTMTDSTIKTNDDYNDFDIFPDSIKYSNREKSIIKRKKYDAYINNQDSLDSDDINMVTNSVFNKSLVNTQ